MTEHVLNVLHLVGSPTDAFFADLSLLYGNDCLRNLADPTRYRFHIAYVSPDGSWRFPESLAPEGIRAAAPMTLWDAMAHIAASGIDVAVPQMFCLSGMTTYRAVLDALGVPFVGNVASVMALGADKAKAKAVVAAAGVRTPESELVRPGEDVSLTPPIVVKPVDADNSTGVSLVTDSAENAAALASAWQHSSAALAERYIPLGREVRCGIIASGKDLLCLPLEEYRVSNADKPIRTARDKLSRGRDGELTLVAKGSTHTQIVDVDDPITGAVWAAAERCHTAMGCRHYSLFDFRVDELGTPWFLEAGLYWSFARGSVLSAMAKAQDLDVGELFLSFAHSAMGSAKV